MKTNEEESSPLEIERFELYQKLMAERFKYYELRKEKPKNRHNKINPR